MKLLDTFEAQFLAALTLWREGRGEPLEGRRAILHVILNRCADPRYPYTVPEVVMQRGKAKNGRVVYQFSCFDPHDVNAAMIPFPSDPQWEECRALVLLPGEDPTEGATNYHADTVNPLWSNPKKVTARIGNHIFLRL